MSLIWGLSAVFSSGWIGVVDFWKEDPRSEVALLSHHIRAPDVCMTSWGLYAWSHGSGGVCQGELLLVLFSSLFGSHAGRGSPPYWGWELSSGKTHRVVWNSMRRTDLWVCVCTLEGTQLCAVCLATSLFQPWLLIRSILGHQDIINPQLLVLSTSSLPRTASHSSFTYSCNVPAAVLQGALVYFIGE